MASEADLDRDSEAIKSLLYRVRPGDHLRVTNNQRWTVEDNGPRDIWVRKVVLEKGPIYPGEFYRIYGEGPRQRQQEDSGCYVLMSEKPEEKGNHPVPEVFHRKPDREAAYRETTKGAIVQLELVA